MNARKDLCGRFDGAVRGVFRLKDRYIGFGVRMNRRDAAQGGRADEEHAQGAWVMFFDYVVSGQQ